MTELEQQVLNRIQTDFPICSDPYGAIAGDLNYTREDVHGAVASLRESGIIRRLGGVFASDKLGALQNYVVLCARACLHFSI